MEIISHQIIYRYYCRGFGDNMKNIVEYDDKFSTLQQLKKYFLQFPSAGYLVGYGKRKPEVPWAIRALLVLKWTDNDGEHIKEFSNATEFVSFLRDNPKLATAINFFP